MQWILGTFPTTVVILKKTPEPDEVKKETDRYIVFATNARARSRQDLISKIPRRVQKKMGNRDRICLHGKGKAANLQQERLDQDTADVPSAGDLQRMDHGKLRGWRMRRRGQARHHTQAPHVSLYPDHSGVHSTFLAVFSLSGICRVVHFQLLLDGVELQFLPPGCPDLNAIEEVWRQMKHAILDVPYVRFSSMCGDIDNWLRSSLPKLDIERYLYRKA